MDLAEIVAEVALGAAYLDYVESHTGEWTLEDDAAVWVEADIRTHRVLILLGLK